MPMPSLQVPDVAVPIQAVAQGVKEVAQAVKTPLLSFLKMRDDQKNRTYVATKILDDAEKVLGEPLPSLREKYNPEKIDAQSLEDLAKSVDNGFKSKQVWDSQQPDVKEVMGGKFNARMYFSRYTDVNSYRDSLKNNGEKYLTTKAENDLDAWAKDYKSKNPDKSLQDALAQVPQNLKSRLTGSQVDGVMKMFVPMQATTAIRQRQQGIDIQQQKANTNAVKKEEKTHEELTLKEVQNKALAIRKEAKSADYTKRKGLTELAAEMEGIANLMYKNKMTYTDASDEWHKSHPDSSPQQPTGQAPTGW